MGSKSPFAPLAARAEMARYFEQLGAAFTRARQQVPAAPDREYQLGYYRLRLRFVGEALAPALTSALAHLPPATTQHGLEILCWDGAATGEALPAPPWPWPAEWPACGYITPFENPSFRVSVCPISGVILLYRADNSTAIFWAPDARKLHTYHHGSPFLTLLSWWIQTRTRGLHLLHAGCVGTSHGAALLVGRGGSGKSTTALLCAEAGMNYLSDDYCLVEEGPTPTVCCLYSSGKLHREHLARFPDLAALAVDPRADPFGKPVIFLAQSGRFTVVPRAPLRAILIPSVTGQPETTIETATAAAALRALAPSTLMQLPNSDPAALQSLAALTRQVACFHLGLGTRLEDIAPAVRTLLTRPA
jgi:hypothetical protein